MPAKWSLTLLGTTVLTDGGQGERARHPSKGWDSLLQGEEEDEDCLGKQRPSFLAYCNSAPELY